MQLTSLNIKFIAGILTILTGVFSFGMHASAVVYPITICDAKIREAGIPIDGMSGWPVSRIDFKPEATDAQKDQAWAMVEDPDCGKDFSGSNGAPTIATNFSTGVPTFTADGQISVAQVNGYPYIYFQANGVTQHILGASSFEISAHETTDAISGEKMEVGDFVIGMVDKNLNNGATPEDSSLHGIWVKWSSVKKQLIEELKDSNALSSSGASGDGSVTGVSSSNILTAIADLGITIKNGITHIANLAVDKFTANIARVNKLEMVDKATGAVYCTWLENGQWQKSEGACDELAPQTQAPVIEPIEVVEPSPESVVDTPQEPAQEVIQGQILSEAVEPSPEPVVEATVEAVEEPVPLEVAEPSPESVSASETVEPMPIQEETAPELIP